MAYFYYLHVLLGECLVFQHPSKRMTVVDVNNSEAPKCGASRVASRRRLDVVQADVGHGDSAK